MKMILQKFLLVLFFIFLQAHCRRPSQEDYCPNDCTSSENGRCSTRVKRCLCNRGFFGEDCGQQVPLLLGGVPQTLFILPGSWEYLYLDVDCIYSAGLLSHYFPDVLKDLTFEFSTSHHSTLEYYFLLQDPEESILPEKADPGSLKVSSSALSSHTVTIHKKELEAFEGGLLLVGIKNVDAQQTVAVTLRTHWGPENTSSFSSFFDNAVELIPWGFVAVIFAGVCLAIARIFGWQFVEDDDGTFIFVRNPPRPKRSLTKEDLDTYFPIQKFSDIEISFDQTACSVCLVNYDTKDDCRRLDCGHIFHPKCIEDWLAKNNLCPNCKIQVAPKMS